MSGRSPKTGHNLSKAIEMKTSPKGRARKRVPSHKYESVPDALIKVGLYLPVDVNMGDLEWDEPSAPRHRSYSEWAQDAKQQLMLQGGSL
jgi:hypothetical protein